MLHDIEVMAKTLWAESRGEGKAGMEAVACVILNRCRDPQDRWPDMPAEVCKQRLQFSCWNSDDPNLPKLMQIDHADASYRMAYAIAARAVADDVADKTGAANHYLSRQLFNSPKRPPWADPDKVTVTISNHVFLKL